MVSESGVANPSPIEANAEMQRNQIKYFIGWGVILFLNPIRLAALYQWARGRLS
jgi:hypothetical protein